MRDAQSKKVVKLIKEKKIEFYQRRFLEADHKETFRLFKSLINPPEEMALPRDQDEESLAREFSGFFQAKIAKIHESLQTNPTTDDAFASDTPCEFSFTQFTTQSSEDISRLITKMPTKTCPLDPLPTWLLKDSKLHSLVAVITGIINRSLSEGYVPQMFKIANVCPRLKKPTADPNTLENYRPVSNLPFLSKVLEKVVAQQITTYLDVNNLVDPLQSAYRKAHSTETAMLKVKCDADQILDDGDGVLLVLLDLSAAFDTLNHATLMRRLEETVGIRGTALKWFHSYLTDRHQRVLIGETASPDSLLVTGVPQGSVLGPLLFSLYVLPLMKIIERHGIRRHHYADDIQLYRRLHIQQLQKHDETELKQDLDTMESCIEEIRQWMTSNDLKLNEGKTEMLVIAPKNKQHLLEGITIRVGNDIIIPSKELRDLGSRLDATLSMRGQVASTIKSAYFHMRSISRIRPHLTDATCAKLINSIVTSRQDYHNGLLAGCHQCITKPLQRLQNHSARILTRTRKTDHITPVLRELHWLPIKERVDFKLLVHVQSAVHDLKSPLYLRNMFSQHQPTRPLRSSDDPAALAIPRSRRHEGDRCSAHYGARLWNSLPSALRRPMNKEVFKKNLKTFLFNRAFNS